MTILSETRPSATEWEDETVEGSSVLLGTDAIGPEDRAPHRVPKAVGTVATVIAVMALLVALSLAAASGNTRAVSKTGLEKCELEANAGVDQLVAAPGPRAVARTDEALAGRLSPAALRAAHEVASKLGPVSVDSDEGGPALAVLIVKACASGLGASG